MAFYIKQNDSSPSLRVSIKDGDGDAINLTGASVRFHLVAVGETTPVIDAPANIVVPEIAGIVQYDWESSQTSVVGSYKGEFEVTFPGGSVETFPNSGYISVVVTKELS